MLFEGKGERGVVGWAAAAVGEGGRAGGQGVG